MSDSARPPRPPKKIATMNPWRTTSEMQAATYAAALAQRISYGELMRRAVAAFLTGDAFHDFEDQPVVHGLNVFPDSAFDPDSRV
jgi:hypothetical protein